MKKHLEVVGALIVEKGRVFAAKRGESRYPYVAHKYELVGGKIEAGESPEAALVREVREELGADIRILRPYALVRHEYPDFTITLHVYRCAFLTEYKNTEHESLRWLSLCDLREEEWAPADAPVVRALREGKLSYSD
ncbi:MAG TPA: (deoxy)nucleoside triphosphate pyrophosphohydrolase [Candidatus Borkfalkia excrementavium]|uniref:8-oxo-dGTP diphosphatase n=1 Tax=Candidatus Borkfalkia excrementavium TaxID=2838505 RepID=A0A9D2CF37_9FIRM|nr:(deoxy)nucleoside triphosphate pyrophosphohydrolase [Candidatus Borkfalkia excrementavium]